MHWARSSASVSQLNASLSIYNNLASYFVGMLDYCSSTGKRYSGIVPVALSIQNARTTYLSTLSYNVGQAVNYNTDPQIGLQRDGGHLTFNVGRYIAALTFAEYLIPEEIRTSQYTIPDIRITESIGRLPKEYTTIAQQAVLCAINSWKEGNLQVTNIEGYEKDPTTLFAEKFNEDLYVDFEITEENVEIYLEDYLLEDMVLENVVVSKNEDVYEVEATVRFGYTTLKVDISLLLDITYIPKEEIDFSNLTYTAFGDSITYGADLIIGGRVENPYPTVLSEILGLKSYENKGISGATLTTNDQGLTCMTDVITAYNSKTDIIGVLGGVNDYNRNLPLGDIDDNDTSTIYGSLHVGMSYLSENYSDAFVFYMTPYKEYFHGVLWSDINSQGYNLEDVANAIKEVAEIYDIPVLDLLEEGNFESIMYNDDCDGIHPNQEFITNVMAPQIAEFIKENYE